MTASLSGLVDLLEAKAREFRAITYDTLIRQTAEKPLDEATAAALEEIAARVRQINRKASGLEKALIEVRALAAQLDDEVKQANSQLGDMPDIASFFLNPMKLFSALSDTGRITGIRQAAEIIRQYLDQSQDI